MQQLDYSLIKRRAVVPTSIDPAKAGKSCFMDENRHNRLFADKDVNEYINAQIKKASEILDEKNK